MLALSIQIDAAFQVLTHSVEFQQLTAQVLIHRSAVAAPIDNPVAFTHDQIGVVLLQPGIHLVQISLILVEVRRLFNFFTDILLCPAGQTVKYLKGVTGKQVDPLRQPVLLLKCLGLIGA